MRRNFLSSSALTARSHQRCRVLGTAFCDERTDKHEHAYSHVRVEVWTFCSLRKPRCARSSHLNGVTADTMSNGDLRRLQEITVGVKRIDQRPLPVVVLPQHVWWCVGPGAFAGRVWSVALEAVRAELDVREVTGTKSNIARITGFAVINVKRNKTIFSWLLLYQASCFAATANYHRYVTHTISYFSCLVCVLWDGRSRVP